MLNANISTSERAAQNGAPHSSPANLTGPDIMLFADALSVAMADATAAHEARLTGLPRGPVTGFRLLDTELGGAFAPGVHSINGDPGIGKTAFALQVAATCQFPALFVTCEMAPAELLRRHASRVTETFLGRFKSGEMHPTAARELFKQGIEATPMLALLDGTKERITPAWIQEQARMLLNRFESRGILIVIDSLHSWAEGAASGTGAGEYETLNEAVARLRAIAHALNCPVLFVTEKNRESMRSGEGGQSTGAGSRKIEYGAETVISLMRGKDAKGNATEADGDGETPVTLMLAKNRHGAINKPVKVTFNGALQRFKSAGW